MRVESFKKKWIYNFLSLEDINELYNDDTNRFNREHDTDQRYMQVCVCTRILH